MKVVIKTFSVDMEVKSNSVEFQVHSNAGDHLGGLLPNKDRSDLVR